MTAAIANLALNVLMVALLVATIAYCWLLNKRIKILQDSKGELANLMRHFDESTQRASDSIMALQNASKKIGENMQTRIDKANFLLDDLAFMIEKGNKLANQMEASLAVGRARNKVMTQKPEPEPVKSWLDEVDEQVIEDELPPELQLAPNPNPVRRQQQPEKPGIKEKTAASLSAVLERLGNRSNAQPAQYENEPARGRPAFAGSDKQERPRSKVEQELLDIIRAGVKG